MALERITEVDISFEMSPEDLAAGYSMATTEAGRQLRRRSKPLVACFSIGVIALLIAMGLGTSLMDRIWGPARTELGWFMVFAVVSGVAFFISLLLRDRNMMAIEAEALGAFPIKYSVRVRAECLETYSRLGHTLLAWPAVRGVLNGPQHVGLQVPSGVIPIPHRAFHTDAERASFVNEVRSKMHAQFGAEAHHPLQ